MGMSVIEFEHTFLSEQNLDAVTRQLEAKSARWRLPLTRSEPIRSRQTQIAYILLLDPAVEFDDGAASFSEVETILRRHGFKKRLTPCSIQ